MHRNISENLQCIIDNQKSLYERVQTLAKTLDVIAKNQQEIKECVTLSSTSAPLISSSTQTLCYPPPPPAPPAATCPSEKYSFPPSYPLPKSDRTVQPPSPLQQPLVKTHTPRRFLLPTPPPPPPPPVPSPLADKQQTQ